jgi:hypothetical protein
VDALNELKNWLPGAVSGGLDLMNFRRSLGRVANRRKGRFAQQFRNTPTSGLVPEGSKTRMLTA